MKRITARMTIVVFVLCASMIAPFSYADDNDNGKFIYSEKYENWLKDLQKASDASEKKKEDQKSDRKNDKDEAEPEDVISGGSVVKDTSWFDYEDPQTSYKISNESQLIGLASLINEEQIDRWKPTRIENFEGVTFTLTKDIQLTKPWTPIGKGGASYFAGTFDGGGHTISNLQVDITTGYSGLFGSVSGEVKNLHVQGTVTSKDSACGGIAGYLNSTAIVMNCTSDVTVSGRDKTGGIAGYNEGGVVESCINVGSISGTHKVGGVVGENWGGSIRTCGNRGTVESTNRGVATYGTGGVAGRSVSATAIIAESYNAGEIHSYTEATGGVAGYINAAGSAIEDCYNTGNILITKKEGEKELTSAYAGGVVGIAGTNGVIIQNCYNAGTITEADVTGGVAGLYLNATDYETEQYLFNNYYLSDHTPTGFGEIEDEDDPFLENAAIEAPGGAMGNLQASLSVAYMKDTGEYGNQGYPVLRWQTPVSEEEQASIVDFPVDKQKLLDEYLVRTAAVTPPGQPIINFFKPDNIMSNAFILYMEATDKMKED